MFINYKDILIKIMTILFILLPIFLIIDVWIDNKIIYKLLMSDLILFAFTLAIYTVFYMKELED